MDSKTFNQVVSEQFAHCETLLGIKAVEYADGDMDRLHNFKIAAALGGCSPRRALSGMMAKHTVSIYDMCSTDAEYSQALWDEKITDSINYLLLLQAIVREEAEFKMTLNKAASSF